MNQYTEEEIRELAKTFDILYPEDNLFNVVAIEKCLTVYSDNLVGAIMSLLLEFKHLGNTDEDLKYLFKFTFEEPLNCMPKYLNDNEKWKITIASWRLKIGK
jgi:hypothetical protein